MTHRTTIHLSDIAGEIERELIDQADALAPDDPAEPIIVETAPHAIVDGFHRTAGYLRWAREQGLEAADVEIPVVVCDDDELVALAAEPGEHQEAAIEAIYALADGEDPRAVTVVGLGATDWTDDDASAWERYGVIDVEVAGETYELGCAIGVPEHLRGTAEAAGGDTITPYLTAWYVSRSDWECAGVPAYAADAVLAAILEAAPRLWDEYEEERGPRYPSRAALVAAIEGARLGSVDTDYDPETGCGTLSTGVDHEAEPDSAEFEAEYDEHLKRINTVLRPLGLVAQWDGYASDDGDGDTTEFLTVGPLED